MVNILGADMNQWLLLIAFAGVFIGIIMLVWVNKSVGLKFAWQLFNLSKKKNRGKILLEVLVPNGYSDWKIVNASKMIEYKYKENGKTKEGMVMYDPYCVKTMFNNIKVLQCRTDDVFPVNPHANTSLTISGEVFKKNAVDASKEDFSNEGFKKIAKIALPLVIAIGVILILYSQNQADTVTNLTAQLAQCYANTPNTAIIQAN